jgi:hypothetical protein
MQLKQLNLFLKLENEFNVNNLDVFEEIAKNNCGNTMIQNILNPKQIIDDKFKPIIIFLKKTSDFLDCFVINILRNIIFQHCFLGNQDHLLNVHIKNYTS